ncbi:MAG: hypothetical protein ACE37E_11110 [Hyphomicrobiales bacterium]
MMQALVTSGFLGSSFRRGANEEAYRRALHQHKTAQDRERRQKQDEARNDAAEFGDFATTVITDKQAATFQIELDTYQTATVEALEINREALDLAREQLAATLAEAYVLEDGRRVFETEDGLRVFDEFGNELSADTITPEEIPDQYPSWEHYLGRQQNVQTLEAEQTELLDFQTDLDAATDRLDSGDLTVDEYDELRAELRDAAPQSVNELLGRASVLENDATAPAPNIDLNLDADLAAAIQPSVPGLRR